MQIKVRILGCGTSTGVPVIGCDCPVCTGRNPFNVRTRSSALLSYGGRNVLIDTSTDLRAQALAASLTRVDAVLFTHAHADHVHGIDDLRAFNLLQKQPIPCYASATTAARLGEIFSYIFVREQGGGWKPELEVAAVEAPFELFGAVVVPVPVEHGRDTILGYRVGSFAYLTDCSTVPPESMEMLAGVRVLVIGALRQRPHPSHFSIPEAVDVAERLGAERTVLTHMGHKVDYTDDAAGLPPGVELAHDGLVLDVD